MSIVTQFLIDPGFVPVGDPHLDDALFDWVRAKLDVGGCQSLDDLLAIAALGEKFRSRPLSGLPIFDRIGSLMVRVKRVVCQKCGRTWQEPLAERLVVNAYGQAKRMPTEVSVQWCSQCSHPQRQPEEGETFKPRKAKGRGGLMLQGWRDRVDRGNRDRVVYNGENFDVTEPANMDQALTRYSQQSSAHQEQAERNREATERERILTPEWIRKHADPDQAVRIAERLTTASRSEISRITGLTDSQVRAANNDELWALLMQASKAA